MALFIAKDRTKIPALLPLAEACRVLGISVDSFERHWRNVFTNYRTDGNQRRVSEDELKEARRHVEPLAARAAVLNLRAVLKRLES